MSHNRRNRKAFDIVIVDRFFHADILCVITESRTEHQRNLRHKIRLCTHALITSLQLIIYFAHFILLLITGSHFPVHHFFYYNRNRHRIQRSSQRL